MAKVTITLERPHGTIVRDKVNNLRFVDGYVFAEFVDGKELLVRCHTAIKYVTEIRIDD